MRQYVTVKFRPRDQRGYTYHNDDAPVRIGDRVKIPDRSGNGWSHAEVIALPPAAPAFETKAILGLVDGTTIDEALLAAPPVALHKPDLFSTEG